MDNKTSTDLKLLSSLATQAQKTPGLSYYSSDFVGAAFKNIGNGPLYLIAAQAPKFLDNDTKVTFDFIGLTLENVRYGDFSVSVVFDEFDIVPNDEEAVIENDVTALRDNISNEIELVSNSCIVGTDFGDDLPDKEMENGDKLSPFEQGAMFLCYEDLRNISFYAAYPKSSKIRKFNIEVEKHA